MEKNRAANDNSIFRKCTIIISGALLVLFAGSAVSQAALNISPASVSAAKGQNTMVTLTWRLTGESPGLWTSSQGVFENATGLDLGSPRGPLSINVDTSGNGSAIESLLIPSSVVASVAQGGELSFAYRRDFDSPIPTNGGLIGRLNINIVLSQASGPLSLRRVELYYEEDGRKTNEVTVARNARGLSAMADLYVNGTGYVEGYWEVDGRRLENMREYASFGSKLTVRTSDIPGVPTFRPGLHSVRLVITSPAPGFALPRIGYIVTSETAQDIRLLRVLAPEGGAELNAETAFSWTQGPEAAFVLTFTEQLKGEMVLTAQTKEPSYTIPARLLSERFSPGASYLWQVKGYGTEGELVSETRPRKITVGE